MADFKATMFFRVGAQGWSESFYKQTAASQEATLAAFRETVTLRRRLMPRPYAVTHIRVTAVGQPRDSIIESFTGVTGQGLYAGLADDAGTAVNLRMFAGLTTWRSFLMRGLPQEAQDTQTNLIGAGPWREALTAWSTKIKEQAWSIQKSVFSAPITLVNVGMVSGRIRNLQVSPPLNPDPPIGYVLQVRGASLTVGINGLWRVNGATTTDAGPPQVMTVPVREHAQPVIGTYGLSSGTVRVVTYQYPSITDIQPIGLTTRDTGRPSYQRRGKRSVRRT